MVKFELKGKTHNFFHIPKTGGTSLIEGVIWNNFKYFHMFELFPEYTLGPNHLSYREYEEVGAVLPDDINITIVREPIARVISFYKNFVVKDTRDHDSFTEWFSYMKETYPYLIRSQKQILTGGKYLIFNFDRIHEIEEYLGQKLPFKNVINYDVQVTNDEVDHLKEYYQEDFEMLEHINYAPLFHEL